MAVSSFAHRDIALWLQAAYSDHQIGAFGNFLRFQYELRFVGRLKSQLLISHLFLPIKQMPRTKKKEREIKPLLGNIPDFLHYPINFCFSGNAPRVRSRRFLVQHRFRSHTHIAD
jgi:hypothetical protein